MPLLQVQTSAEAAPAPAGLLKDLSAELARQLGKPEADVEFVDAKARLWGYDGATFA